MLPSDEFYLTAGREIHDSSFYEDFLQIENGVGMWASLRDDYLAALEDAEPDGKKRSFSVATAALAAPLMEFLMKKPPRNFPGLIIKYTPYATTFSASELPLRGCSPGAT